MTPEPTTEENFITLLSYPPGLWLNRQQEHFFLLLRILTWKLFYISYNSLCR